MKLRKLAKDGTSGVNNCPTIYLAESGEAVVQGQLVDEDTLANLEDLLPGEAAVRIAADVVEAAAAKLVAERGES